MTDRQIAERMQEDAFMKGCDIAVLVEDWKDEIFWATVIKKALPRCKLDFPYQSTRGKDAILKYKEFVNNRFIICVDSDNTYLFTEKHYLEKDFIFHTYTYNIESYQCNPNSLKQLCKEIVINDNFNFTDFFTHFSEITATLFYFWIYVYSSNIKIGKSILNKENLENIFSYKWNEIKNLSEINTVLQHFTQNINKLLYTLYQAIPWYESVLKTEIPAIKEKIKKQFHINENELFLFFNGHVIFEKIAMPLLETVIKFLKKEKINEINSTLKNSKGNVLAESLKKYENMTRLDLKTKMNDNYNFAINNYETDKWMMKIITDIKKVFS